MHSLSYSSLNHIALYHGSHTDQRRRQVNIRLRTQRVQWLLNAQTRAAANVSIEKKQKTSVSKDRRYTKPKKKVTGDFFVCSCHTSLTATGPCDERAP